MFCGVSDDYMQEMVNQLQQRGFYPKILIQRGLKQSNYPETKFFDIIEVQDMNFYSNAINTLPVTVSEDLLLKLKECESIFYAASDRLAYFPISVRQRRTYFLQVVNYWHYFLNKNSIECIIFKMTPHMGYDIIIYHLAKLLDIKVFYLERTSINDHILINDDYRAIKDVPGNYLSDLNISKLKYQIGDKLYERVFEKSYWTEMSKELNKRSSSKNLFNKFLRLLKKIIFLPFLISSYMEKRKRSFFAMNKPVRNYMVDLLASAKRVNDRKRKKQYEQLCIKPDYEKKYIFFPLNFQPERSTVPLGGEFDDQITALRMLSEGIPESWNIYVKEHPRQLNNPKFNDKHARNEQFYIEINEINKVSFIDINEESNLLIRKAKFTATISGTAGWESLISGKPCIVFGYPWYLGCRSCFKVGSLNQVKIAIQECLLKSKDLVDKDLLKYLLFNKNRFVESVNDKRFADMSSITYERLASNMAEKLLNLYNYKL